MKRNAKLVSFMLAVLLTISLAGCGGAPSAGQSGGSSSSGANTAGADAVKEYPEIEIWVGQVRDFSEITKVQEQWREKLGFNTRVKNVTGDVETALNLALASGGFKDMAVIDKNDIYNNNIVRSGSVMEATDILGMKDYPNISSIPEPYLAVSKDKDGKFWYIPTNWDVDINDPWTGWTRQAFMINGAILKELGISADSIKTISDFENYLKESAKLTGPSGSKYIPTTYSNPETVLTAFGVKTGRAAGGVASVAKVGNGFVFQYDDPNYAEAFRWLNKLVREGLMDEESVIQKSDVRREKVYSGKYASVIGYEDFVPTKPGDPYREFFPIPFPKAENVEKPGQQFVVNPYPKSSVYISKNTKNLDAILAFLNWSLEKLPERHFELSEGIRGTNWDWVSEPYGAWTFDPAYEEARNNPATRANLQPELYMLGTMSKTWYPWWTKQQPPEAGNYIHVKHNEEIFTYGTHDNIHSWDAVKSEKGSLWEKYGPTVEQIVSEYTAKLILSSSDNQFEQNWKEFRTNLESKGHWTELKNEWNSLYKAQTQVTGEW